MESRDQPMPGSFPAPPNFNEKSPGNEVVQFSLGLVPTAILFLHVVLWPGFFAANAEEMSTIATFVATAGKVS